MPLPHALQKNLDPSSVVVDTSQGRRVSNHLKALIILARRRMAATSPSSSPGNLLQFILSGFHWVSPLSTRCPDIELPLAASADELPLLPSDDDDKALQAWSAWRRQRDAPQIDTRNMAHSVDRQRRVGAGLVVFSLIT